MAKRGEAWHAEVLDILHREARPLSAYDILGKLRSFNPKIAPPTVYRAMSALTDLGHVHRIESLNAYVSCQCAEHHHRVASILSICEDCGAVEESLAPEMMEHLSVIAAKSGFAAQRHVVELHGVCASCRPAEMQP